MTTVGVGISEQQAASGSAPLPIERLLAEVRAAGHDGPFVAVLALTLGRYTRHVLAREARPPGWLFIMPHADAERMFTELGRDRIELPEPGRVPLLMLTAEEQRRV